MLSDETAYHRYLDGEEDAAALLVERYGDRLTLYINGYLHDIHEAEDLMLEAFSLLFVKARPIRGPGGFRVYLFQTARRLALRHSRSRLPLLTFDDADFDLPDDVQLEDELLRTERSRQLYRALEQLKPEYREALFLTCLEGLSYREAAAVMGKKEQQITNLVHRGKQSLKTILERDGFTYANE